MRIAVVGAGISGISAAYHLHNKHEVTLIEKRSVIGGHSNTITTQDPAGNTVSIDTGFIVYNERNYPTFFHFLQELKVENHRSDMSFSYTNMSKAIQYAGTIGGLFPSLKSITSASHIHRLFNIYKYSKLLEKHSGEHLSVGINIVDLLTKIGCPLDIINNYFVPIASAIWSCDGKYAAHIPASTFMQFFSNHGLLNIKNRPQWLTIRGASRNYINQFSSIFRGRIYTNVDVTSVKSINEKAVIESAELEEQEFDVAIIATHADEALKITRHFPKRLSDILSTYEYSENDAFLHIDKSLMPNNKRVWASWNVINVDTHSGPHSFTTYYMNRLQQLQTSSDFFVTINPYPNPSEENTLYKTKYTHPILNHDQTLNYNNFKVLNQYNAIRFCGSYFGYGFHEDAFVSGKMVADTIGKF